MYYATYDGYADKEFGGGFANTKSVVAFRRRINRDDRCHADLRYTRITRRDAIKRYGLRAVEGVEVS